MPINTRNLITPKKVEVYAGDGVQPFGGAIADPVTTDPALIQVGAYSTSAVGNNQVLSAGDLNGPPLVNSYGIAQIMQYGIAPWVAEYYHPKGARVWHNGQVWVATENIDQQVDQDTAPGQPNAPWVEYAYYVFNEIYPLSSVYINTVNPTNPADSSLLGFGTWASMSPNYALAQAGDLYTAGQTYEDQIQEHGHRWNSATMQGGNAAYAEAWARDDQNGFYTDDNNIEGVLGANVGSETRGKRIGVYMWVRVA